MLLRNRRDVGQVVGQDGDGQDGGRPTIPPIDVVIDARSVLDATAASEVCTPAEASLRLHLITIRDRMSRGSLRSLSWADTRDMIADSLTKGSIDRTQLLQSMQGRFLMKCVVMTHWGKRGKYDPTKADRNAPFGHWHCIVQDSLQVHAPERMPHLDMLSDAEKGREAELHSRLKAQCGGFHDGILSAADLPEPVPKRQRYTDTCRICGEHGHHGNQCPQRVKPPIALTPRMLRPRIPTLNMLPGHTERQRKPKVPTAAMMVNGSVKTALGKGRYVVRIPTTSKSEGPTKPKVPRYIPDIRTKTEGLSAIQQLGDTKATTEGYECNRIESAGPVRGPITFVRYPSRVPGIDAAGRPSPTSPKIEEQQGTGICDTPPQTPNQFVDEQTDDVKMQTLMIKEETVDEDEVKEETREGEADYRCEDDDAVGACAEKLTPRPSTGQPIGEPADGGTVCRCQPLPRSLCAAPSTSECGSERGLKRGLLEPETSHGKVSDSGLPLHYLSLLAQPGCGSPCGVPYPGSGTCREEESEKGFHELHVTHHVAGGSSSTSPRCLPVSYRPSDKHVRTGCYLTANLNHGNPPCPLRILDPCLTPFVLLLESQALISLMYTYIYIYIYTYILNICM